MARWAKRWMKMRGIGVAHLHHRFAVVIFPEVIEMIRVDLERLAWGRMSKAGDR